MSSIDLTAGVPLRGRAVPLIRGGRGSTIALAAAALIFVVALAAPLLAPHDPSAPVGPELSGPGVHYLFGTDEVGRDILSRALFGLRATWFASLAVVGSGVIIGALVGLVAGMSGGLIDSFLMRATDAFLALPAPLLAIAVVSALGPSLRNSLLALAIVWWPLYARIVRGEVRTLLTRPFYEAAQLAGIGRLRRAVRHLLPGAMAPVLVAASLDVGLVILALASLSFLGLGSPEPAPELGAMVARGLPYLLDSWWVPLMPALTVFVVALVANMAGDALRDRLAR
jgi:ABC-type dipeptide/oligopeptide/nickel transport system permease subunit